MSKNDSENLHVVNIDLMEVEQRIFEMLLFVSWRLREAFMCWLHAACNLNTLFNSIYTYLDTVILIL